MHERDTCYSALDTLQSCTAGLASQDLQQLCCIPFHALEGMNCFWSVNSVQSQQACTVNKAAGFMQA